MVELFFLIIMIRKSFAYSRKNKCLGVDKRCLAVHRVGYHDGRLFGRGARDQEPDGNRDTRHKIYIGSGRQCDVCPVLCWFVLLEYEIGCGICRLGDPCPSLYTLEGYGYKESILVGYMIIITIFIRVIINHIFKMPCDVR
jgi:hypothetical protein